MLIRHSGLYVTAKLLPGALGLLTTAVLTRSLPPDAYGVYGVALVIMSLGATLGFDWLGLAYLRLAQAQSDQARTADTFNRLFAALLVAAGLVGIACVTAAPAPDRPAVASGFVLMGAYAWFEFRARFYVAGLAPGAYLRMNLVRAAAVLAGSGVTAWLTSDPAAAALATAAATLAASFAGGRTGGGSITLAGGNSGFDPVLARAAIAFGLPLAAGLLLSSATGSLTRGLVGAIGGVQQLGFYTAAFALVQNTLTVLAAGIAAAGFSMAVGALEGVGIEAARRQLAANGALLLAVLAPAALGMALTADNLAATLVGPAYREPVARLTPWMAAGAFLAAFRSHYLDHAFHLGRRMRGQVWVAATAAIITLGLDAVLIPRLGPIGAAVAVVAGAAAALAHGVVAGRTAFPIPLPTAQAARIAGACAVMAAGVLAVPGTGPGPLVAQVGMGVLGYGAAAIGLDVIGSRTAVAARLRRTRLGAGRTI